MKKSLSLPKSLMYILVYEVVTLSSQVSYGYLKAGSDWVAKGQIQLMWWRTIGLEKNEWEKMTEICNLLRVYMEKV